MYISELARVKYGYVHLSAWIQNQLICTDVFFTQVTQVNVHEMDLKKLLHTGGDDVQQLCEAGEDEFLEIMALVGMASKPLHVRRLQKALQEWALFPGINFLWF